MRIEEKYNGMRIDAVVPQINDKISRSLAQELIKEGKILLDGKVVKVSSKVQEGQEIYIPEDTEKDKNEELVAEDIPIDIIYEDEDIIVVNKPKNMVVHPAVGNRTGTLVNAMLGKSELSSINGEFRPGIVHRLDKDTSGLLIIAKNDLAHMNMSKQIQDRKVIKKYIALVRGTVPENEATIDMPIARSQKDRKKMAVDKNGKEAVTHFKVLARYDKYTLLEVKIDTGRTHQIRVHMSYIGHPVIGDEVYSNGKNEFGVKGQMLHAKYLEFKHPITGKDIKLEAPLPEYFEEVLKQLEERKLG